MPIELVAYKHENVDMDADENEMKENASQVFTKAVKRAKYEQAEDRILFGNHAGIDMIESNAQVNIKTANLNATVKGLYIYRRSESSENPERVQCQVL